MSGRAGGAGRYFYTVEQIDRMLVNKMEALARALAPDGERRGHEWVAKNPARSDARLGSFSINLNTGVWKDFSAGDGAKTLPGLGLVAYLATEGDFSRAITWAKSWLGLTDEKPDPAVAQKLEAQAKRSREDELRRRQAKLNAAFAIYLDAMPLSGACPGSLYLKARGIEPAGLEEGRFPRSLKFHPRITHPHHEGKVPALIACQSLEGKPHGFAGIHRIYLAETGGVWGKAFAKDAKLSLGYQLGASIRIAKGVSKKAIAAAPAGEWVHACEGIEDALSLALAMPGTRVVAAYSLAALGNLSFPPQIGGVVVMGDNDTGNQVAEDALEAACLKLCDRYPVKLARLPDRFKDVNDCLLGKARPFETPPAAQARP